MSFGFGIGDAIAVSQLVLNASNALESSGAARDEFGQCSRQLSTLHDALGKIEGIGLDWLGEEGSESLRIIMNDCGPLVGQLDAFIREKYLAGPGPPAAWTEEERQDYVPAEFESQLRLYSLSVQHLAGLAESRRRLASAPEPATQRPITPVYEDPLTGSGAVPFRRPRGCVVIMIVFAVFVGLSCFVGLYFTLHKDYGFSMGDSFTLAAYVLTVGAFLSSAVLAYHYPHCRCWRRPRSKKKKQDIRLALIGQDGATTRNATSEALDLGGDSSSSVSSTD